MKTSPPPPEIHPAAVFLDFLTIALLMVWISGGLMLMPPDVHELFRQKPWIHRMLMNGVALTAASIIFAQIQNRLPMSPVLQYCRTLKMPHSQQVFLIFLILTSLLGVSSIARHQVFHTSFDMAIFVQAIWNTTQGDFLYSSIKGGICLLGDHFSPLLAALALPYRFSPDPRILLALQAMAAAACVFPLDKLARLELKNNGHALLLLIAFAFYLPLWNSVRFDFHPELLVMPALLAGFVYLVQRKLIRSSLWLAVALLAKENVPLVTFMVGIYALFFRKEKIYGLFWIFFSLIYFFTVVYIIIPGYSPQGYFYLEANFMAWGKQGGGAFLKHLAQPSTLSYLFKIFAPVGFLSFLDFPSFFLTLPILAQNLLSRNEATRSIFFQYTALLTPFVFISAVYGARKALRKRWGIPYLVAAVIFSGGVSEIYVIREHQTKETTHFQKIREYFKTIPRDVSVRTHEFFAPHLANRRNLHIYENQNPVEGASPAALNSDYVVVDRLFLGDSSTEKIEMLLKQGYREKVQENGFYILARGPDL